MEGTELHFNDRNELDYLVFQVIEREGPREYQGYRAVRLLQLRYISMEARRDAGLLQKMRTVLRGLYGAQVDLVYLAAGVFQNPKIGIVQCYGVAAFSPKKEEAIQRSLRDLSALRAGLVGAYRQMRLEPLSTEVAQWLARSLEQMPYAIVAVGHPDPRENARGGDSSMRDPLMSNNQGAVPYSILSFSLSPLTRRRFPEPQDGIVQCYGVAAFSPKKEEAIQRSLRDLSALRAGLVGAYRQMRLEPLSTEVAQWLARSLEQMPYAIVAVGHPDPRENARGGDSSMRDPLMSASQGAQQYSIQQNELLFRGMSSLEEEFLLMLLTSHVRLEDITRMLSGMLEDTAVYASRQLGTRAASFGISLPAFLTGGLAENASQSYGTNHSSGVTQGVSATDGTAASQGQAHTVGQASTSGWAHTVGVSETDTVGSSSTVGTAITQGTAHTEGTGVTDGSVAHGFLRRGDFSYRQFRLRR